MAVITIIFVGFISAIVAATTGIGWGIIIMPVLVGLLSINHPVAVCATMFSGIVLCIISGTSYLHLGYGDIRLFLLLSAGAAVGAIIGSYTGSVVPAHIMLKVVGLIIIALGLKMVFS